MLEVRRNGVGPHLSPTREQHLRVGEDVPRVPAGAGQRFAVAYVPELHRLAQRGEARECAFAAAALALRGLNVDRAFWSSGWTRPHVASHRRHVWRHAPVAGHVRVLLR